MIKQKNSFIFVNLLALSSQTYFLSAVFAAPNLQSSQQLPGSTTHTKRTTALTQGLERLAGPVSLPDLPISTADTKFFSGNKMSSMRMTVYHMIFFAEKDPQTVLKSYKDALIVQQWSISKDSPDSVSAEHRNGHKCTITVNEAEPPDGKSRLTITYCQMGRIQ